MNKPDKPSSGHTPVVKKNGRYYSKAFKKNGKSTECADIWGDTKEECQERVDQFLGNTTQQKLL